MKSAAKTIFESINSWNDLEKLIDEGESESLYIECKSPENPKLGSGLRNKLGKAISGFSNTSGGLIIWGVSTVKKSHSGLDVLTQIEPIGRINSFSKEILNKAPTLTTPSVFDIQNKVIKKRKSDTSGVVITYIPQNENDPTMHTKDNTFWYRSGDDFQIAPYEMVKRLFAATVSPDLIIDIPTELVEVDKGGFISIPIVLKNRSAAVAQNVKVNITIENGDNIDKIKTRHLSDISNINPGKKIYSTNITDVIHKAFNLLGGTLFIKMKSRKRNLHISIKVFANHMRAKNITMKIKISKDSLEIIGLEENHLF